MSGQIESDERLLLQAAYRNFNLRNIDLVLALLRSDVVWANGMEGGHVLGREAVRAYWLRQWEILEPQVEPLAFERDDNSGVVVKVHQVVRDKTGALLHDGTVHHRYQFSDGLISQMDILTSEHTKKETNER